MAKARLDQLLVTRGLAPSRARAQAIVLAGDVFVGGARVDKAGALVPADAVVEVRGADHPYVSRGGVKLAGALDAFGLDVRDLGCLDLGASTGGFTDCLLQRGATRVVAVDVGYGQLAHKLRVDPRVVVMERTNARALTEAAIGGAADLTVVDASFIGLAKLMPAVARCTREGGALVALVKPQFEVGREQASRGKGVVRDEAARAEAIAGAIAAVRAAGFEVVAESDSALHGPRGNREAFVYARRTSRQRPPAAPL
ncbi:MAG TPA: TlyA family RNA methyltransferase [Polyangiaceae bacterium]|jgi:23S rRNA (cytidine1920-2'-O)/16S rRNA (cytidine1409-2'-O)-methyltransferase